MNLHFSTSSSSRVSHSPGISRRSQRGFSRRGSSRHKLSGRAAALQLHRGAAVHVAVAAAGNPASGTSAGRARIRAVPAEAVAGDESAFRGAAAKRADRVSVGAVPRDGTPPGSRVAAVVAADPGSDWRLEHLVAVSAHLFQGLKGSLDRLPGQPVQLGEDPVLGLASEVAGLSDAAVVLAQGLIQKHSSPVAGAELGLTDVLDPAGLDPVDVDSLTDDEGIGVLRQNVGSRGPAVDSGLGQPPRDHRGHVVVVKRAAARRRPDVGDRRRGGEP